MSTLIKKNINCFHGRFASHLVSKISSFTDSHRKNRTATRNTEKSPNRPYSPSTEKFPYGRMSLRRDLPRRNLLRRKVQLPLRAAGLTIQEWSVCDLRVPPSIISWITRTELIQCFQDNYHIWRFSSKQR